MGGAGDLGGVGGGGRSWDDAGVLGEGPRKNPRSLSSPKLELWPKNSKKGAKGVVVRGRRVGAGGCRDSGRRSR